MNRSLTDRDKAVLDLERTHPGSATAKASVIAGRFGLTPTRYAQVLARLLDDPAALQHDPQLVLRLRRLRDSGRRRRVA